jgi:hypothetical protein
MPPPSDSGLAFTITITRMSFLQAPAVRRFQDSDEPAAGESTIRGRLDRHQGIHDTRIPS